MKGSDLITILEYAKTFNKPPKEPKKKVRKMKDDDDVVRLFRQKLEEAEMLKKFLDEREKLNKKEDKKDDKKEDKGWDASKIALWLMLTFPITGPLYLKFLSVMVPGILGMK